MVHVLQQDLLLLGVSRPLERWAFARYTPVEVPFDFGVGSALLLVPFLAELTEDEALQFTVSRP